MLFSNSNSLNNAGTNWKLLFPVILSELYFYQSQPDICYIQCLENIRRSSLLADYRVSKKLLSLFFSIYSNPKQLWQKVRTLIGESLSLETEVYKTLGIFLVSCKILSHGWSRSQYCFLWKIIKSLGLGMILKSSLVGFKSLVSVSGLNLQFGFTK